MSVPFARRSLFSQPTKLGISVAGVGAALILMLLLLGFREGLYASITAYVDHAGADLFVAQKGATGLVAASSAVRADLAESLRQAAPATLVQPIRIADVIFEYEERKTPVLLVGYATGNDLGDPWRIVEGRHPREGADEILLDQWLAERNGIRLGESVPISGHPLRVVGLTGETSNWMSPFLFLPVSTLGRILGTGDVVSFYLLRLPEDADPEQASRRIERQVAGVHAMSPEMLAGHDRQVLAAVMETPLMVLLGISFVIGTAVLGLTSYTAALERMREYGVLKAIGASPGQMRLWMLKEGLYRGALGYLAGAAGSVGAAWAIESAWPQFIVEIRGSAFVVVGFSLLVMVLLGSLIPLRRVERLEPAMVFRA